MHTVRESLPVRLHLAKAGTFSYDRIMRKQRAVDITNIPSPKRAQSKLIQPTGRSNKSASSTLSLHQKLQPPGPPRSISGINGGSLRTSQFCISSSSMGVRRIPPRILLISKFDIYMSFSVSLSSSLICKYWTFS